MLVPIELQRLANRQGYLSPELALGWRIGTYISETFDGLELTRVSSHAHRETNFALSIMLEWHRSGPLDDHEAGRAPSRVCGYHPPTGTLLKITAIPELTTLQSEIRELERHLIKGDIRASTQYQRGLNHLLSQVTVAPVRELCSIRRERCLRHRRTSSHDSQAEIRCRCCGRRFPREEIWNREGVLCCTTCAGLAPEWFDRQ